MLFTLSANWTKTFSNWNKYISKFNQIHFATWTNTSAQCLCEWDTEEILSNVNKHVLLLNICQFCNLDKYTSPGFFNQIFCFMARPNEKYICYGKFPTQIFILKLQQLSNTKCHIGTMAIFPFVNFPFHQQKIQVGSNTRASFYV